MSQWHLTPSGIKSEVIELDWSQVNQGVRRSTGFETHARVLRFRALGRACAQRDIEALLLGHHQDDNVETVLYRISRGGYGTSLRGMLQNTSIPECQGMYGAAESGSALRLKRSPETAAALGIRVNAFKQEVERLPFPPTAPPSEPFAATGGVLLCRPFLSCIKENLVATCQKNGVPFVQDPTNADASLTSRNSIRSLLASPDDLPRALQPASILSVVERANTLVTNRRHLAHKLLEQCKIIHLNLSGSWLLVKSPPASERHKFFQELFSTYGRHMSHKDLASKAESAQAWALRRITRLISPHPTTQFPLKHFIPFAERVFFPGSNFDLEQKQQEEEKREEQQERKTFTVNGTIFYPYKWKSQKPSKKRSSGNIETDTDNGNLWLIARQPFMRRREPVTRRFDAPISPSALMTCYSPWQIWDNRYWFRLSAIPADKEHQLYHDVRPKQDAEAEPDPLAPTIPLVVRALQQGDIYSVLRELDTRATSVNADTNTDTDNDLGADTDTAKRRTSVDTEDELNINTHMLSLDSASLEDLKSFINLRLARDAPGKVRYTVPIIALDTDPSKGKYQPLALPTLHMRFDREDGYDFTFDGKRWRVRWQWMFKHVDIECLQLMGWADKNAY